MENLLDFNIGKITIQISPGHIYTKKNLPTYYDAELWRFMNCMIQMPKSQPIDKHITLIDIGANVGDSAAHWRKYSDSMIICIEPSEYFFKILQANSEILGNCILIKGLYSAGLSREQVAFHANGQTGATVLSDNASFDGELVDFNVIASKSREYMIIKSDTDGFDITILRDLIDNHAQEIKRSVVAVLVEGPTENQMLDRVYIKNYISLLTKFQKIGYEIIIFSNFGSIFSYCGLNQVSLEVAFFAIIHSTANKHRFAHYFDVFLINREHINVEQGIAKFISECL